MSNRRRMSIVSLSGTILALFFAAATEARTIRFANHDWTVKTSGGRVGPGPNYFSDSTGNVWVDTQGRLHMRITKTKNRWSCAEVVSVESFGYGTYRFYLDSPVDALDPNVVLGLFTWNDDPAYNHRELDIEFARWGSAANANAQYVIQPYTNPANIVRFTEPAGITQSIHSFDWQPSRVVFRSLRGTDPLTQAPGDSIYTWTGYNDVPAAGGENARINLWLFNGRQPVNKQQVEIIIRSFEFIP